MTDAEYEEQRLRVKTLFDKWIEQTGLLWWDVTVDYSRQPAPPSDKAWRSGNWRTTFKCDADWRYASATITAYLPTIAEYDDDEIEALVVHELAHIFLNETRQNDEDWLDHEERVATTLAKAFIWIRNNTRDERGK